MTTRYLQLVKRKNHNETWRKNLEENFRVIFAIKKSIEVIYGTLKVKMSLFKVRIVI